MSDGKIAAEWNVEGFDRPREIKTLLAISLKQENEMCVIDLRHTGINNAVAAAAKKRAWTEILDEIEKEIGKTGLTQLSSSK